MIPAATYRLQFHAGFTFADAERIVPYLHDLGISHVYASPLTEARTGSTHGYDVVDATRISTVLGGEAGLRRLVGVLRQHGMGLILDIVPNHMAASPQNRWWADVLQNGQASNYANFFDIDWARHGGKILLPVLGDPLDHAIANGDIELVHSGAGPVLRLYGNQDFPVSPGSETSADLGDLLQQQHYRLAWWRLGHDELNWRRFFSISELAGLRIEDEAVFDAVHELPLRLYREELIDGLRIDHVDGLSDPAAYLSRLRSHLDVLDRRRGTGRAWLLVEKILGPGESMPAGWPVDGTTGYEFMDEVSQLLHHKEGEIPLGRHWAALSGRPADFEAEESQARRQMLHWEFTAQLQSCVDALANLAARSPETSCYSRMAWGRAVETVLLLFPVYRTYGTGSDAPDEDAGVREHIDMQLGAVSAPGEAALGRTILCWLAGQGPAVEHAGEFVRRFQQLSAPIAAKAVEDTAFYRYGRLLSRNDVGFDAGNFCTDPQQFHRWQVARQRDRPRTMVTTATHDHKRGEDVRARLAAISGMAEEWIAASDEWMARIDPDAMVDRGDLYMLLQVTAAAWPGNPELADFDRYAKRLNDYAIKSLREAKLRSSWTEPGDYERNVTALLDALLTSPDMAKVRGDIDAFMSRLEPLARIKQLAQVFLRNTCPGAPDLYQGAEFADLSLVDPDNRRPVNFKARAEALQQRSSEKQRLLHDLLKLRQQRPAAFEEGYQPQEILGAGAQSLIAFVRGRGPARLLMITGLKHLPGGSSPRFDAMGAGDLVDLHLPQLDGLRLADLASRESSLLEPGLPCGVWQITPDREAE